MLASTSEPMATGSTKCCYAMKNLAISCPGNEGLFAHHVVLGGWLGNRQSCRMMLCLCPTGPIPPSTIRAGRRRFRPDILEVAALAMQ
jgi:hypothetical protein